MEPIIILSIFIAVLVVFITLGRMITMYFNGTAETNKLLKENNKLLTQIIREGKDGKN